jgi:hypothetical protein
MLAMAQKDYHRSDWVGRLSLSSTVKDFRSIEHTVRLLREHDGTPLAVGRSREASSGACPAGLVFAIGVAA